MSSDHVPATIGSRGIQIRSAEDLWRFSQIVAKSELCPKDYIGKPEKVAVAIEFGLELGLNPLAALQNIAVINGRPSIWGDAALAMCVASSHWVHEAFEESMDYDDAGNPLAAHCVVQRRGCKPIKRTFTMADARRAGLANRETWKTYPARMLQMRARAWALRDAFPDVLKGLRISEEEQDLADVATTETTVVAIGRRADELAERILEDSGNGKSNAEGEEDSGDLFAVSERVAGGDPA